MLDFNILNYDNLDQVTTNSDTRDRTSIRVKLGLDSMDSNTIYDEDLIRILDKENSCGLPYLTGQIANRQERDLEQLDLTDGVNLVVHIKNYRNEFKLKTYLNKITSNIRRITFISGKGKLNSNVINFLRNIIELSEYDMDIVIPSMYSHYGDNTFVTNTLYSLYKDSNRLINNLMIPLNFIGYMKEFPHNIKTVLSKVTGELVITNCFTDFSGMIPEEYRKNEIGVFDNLSEERVEEITEIFRDLIRHIKTSYLMDYRNIIDDKSKICWAVNYHNDDFNIAERLFKIAVNEGNARDITLGIPFDRLEVLYDNYKIDKNINKIVVYIKPGDRVNYKKEIRLMLKNKCDSELANLNISNSKSLDKRKREIEEELNNIVIETVMIGKIISIYEDRIDFIDGDEVIRLIKSGINTDFIMDLNYIENINYKNKLETQVIVNSMEKVIL